MYARLVREQPSAAFLWFEYGNAASGLRDYTMAEQAWSRAQRLAPRHAELLSLIGHQYQALRQPVRARDCFAAAAAADPKAINPRISLAVLLEQGHQLAEATSVIEECLRQHPGDEQARYFRAVIERREGQLESAENRLRDLLKTEPRHPFVRYAARYELAQILDRTARFEEAMTTLLAAKQIVAGLTDTALLLQRYDEDAHHFRQFAASLPKDVLRRWNDEFPPPSRTEPARLAFLGGHPRSGTTLLEQILDSHPHIGALDEPTAFQDILQPGFYASRDFSPSRLNLLRRRYLGALDTELGPRAAGRLRIDKNPSPTSRLPIWLRLFPELKIIIALRDPRDVVLSCFFQNLALNGTNVNFLSLDRLARHYSDLMDIWIIAREWDGIDAIESRYESLVQEVETEGRRVTEFLGLNWVDTQHQFHEASRRKQMYSPTYQDVTRPVYSSSVGRWQAYERFLSPILPRLEPYCRRWGYL